jgi:hypothetical protein
MTPGSGAPSRNDPRVVSDGEGAPDDVLQVDRWIQASPGHHVQRRSQRGTVFSGKLDRLRPDRFSVVIRILRC